MSKIQQYIMEAAITDDEIRAALSKGEVLLYGIKKGNTERYQEELLYTKARSVEDIRKIIKAASADGWHSFRVAGFTPGTKPNFGVRNVTGKVIPANLPEESTCAIHTIAFLLDKPPHDVWENSKEFWAIDRTRAGLTGNSIKKVLDKYGYGVIDRPEFAYQNRQPLTFRKTFQILDDLPNRKFIVSVMRHVIGVKDGEIKDTARTPPGKRVQYVLEVVDAETARNNSPNAPIGDPLKMKYVQGIADDPDDEEGDLVFRGIYLSNNKVFVQRKDRTGFDIVVLRSIRVLDEPAPQFLYTAIKRAASKSR